MAPRHRDPSRAPRGVETDGVDDRREITLAAMLDDLVEDRERVVARADVVFAGADDRAQGIARDDLLGCELLGRPRALPGTGRADEHDEAR